MVSLKIGFPWWPTRASDPVEGQVHANRIPRVSQHSGLGEVE